MILIIKEWIVSALCLAVMGLLVGVGVVVVFIYLLAMVCIVAACAVYEGLAILFKWRDEG